MNHDFSQSVSQGSNGAQEAEDNRIAAIADELRRRCKLYEAQLRTGENHVSHQQVETLVTEHYANSQATIYQGCPSCHTNYD